MKNLILLCLAFFFALTINAQNETADTTKVRLKNYELIIVEDINGEITTELKKIEDIESSIDNNITIKKRKKRIEIRIEEEGGADDNNMEKIEKEMIVIEKKMKELDKDEVESFEQDMEDLEQDMEELAEDMEDLVEEMEGKGDEIRDEVDKKFKVFKKKGKYKLYSNWGGLGYGFESLESRGARNNDNFFDVSDAHSINWEFFAVSAHLGTPYVAFTTGLGVEWSHRNLEKNYRIVNNDGVTSGVKENNVNLTKNKLVQTVLNVPLMLEFSTSTNKKKNIKVSFGYIQRIAIKSKAVYKSENSSRNNKETVRDDFNLLRYRGAVTARIGYRGVTAFATYDLDQIFEDNKGPELYPFTVGANFRIIPVIRWNTRKRRS